MINEEVNLRAYKDVESLENFKDRGEIMAYRRKRLQRQRPICEFLLRFSEEKHLSVVEIGSGSSALLYALSATKMLKHGYGIEISRSRFDFAELWKSEENYTCVENSNSNFSETKMAASKYNWFQ